MDIGIQLGVTFPLQRKLKIKSVPYGEPLPLMVCWDLHCITLQGRSSLLAVHCASRYTVVVYDLNGLDWARLPEFALEQIELGLEEAGIEKTQVQQYLREGSDNNPVLTRTHGRRPVAFLNRAWEDVMALDYLLDPSRQEQPLLNQAVNELLCRCAGYEGRDTALAFLFQAFTAWSG